LRRIAPEIIFTLKNTDMKTTSMKTTNMKIKLTISLLLTFLTFNGVAETVYIDDQIKVWSRTGPTNGYRLSTELAPGAKLEVLQKNDESGFVEVKDIRGRTGWVESKFLTSSPTAHQKLDSALKLIESLKKSHSTKVTTLEKRVQDLAPLEAFNLELQNKLATQQSELEMLRQKSQMYEGGFYSEVLFAGSLVVLGGMLIGWLLTKIGGRRRNSGWG
jgi:SH3 domain protein